MALLPSLCDGRKIEGCLAEKEKKMTENNMTTLLWKKGEVGGGCYGVEYFILFGRICFCQK